MTVPRKCVVGTEAANEELRALIDKALGFPARGTNVGLGPHPVIQETWDGNGPTPVGWARTAVNLHTGPTNSVLELPDNFAVLLNGPTAQSRLTGQERAQVAIAIAGRITIDIPGSGYTLKPLSNGGASFTGGGK